MSTEETSYHQNEPDKTAKKSDSINDSINKIKNTENNENPNCEREKKTKKHGFIKSCIDKFSIADGINFGMLVCTAGLFVITGYSTCLTRRAIVSSDSTNTQTLAKMQRLADATQGALTENKTEFGILNEPLLALGGNIGLSNWKNLDSFSIATFFIYNMSKRPIKIDTLVYGIRSDTMDVYNIFLKRDTNVRVLKTPAYVLFEYPYEIKDYYAIINTREYINALKRGVNTFFGVVFYRNYLDGKRRYYIFSVRIAPPNTCCAQLVKQIYITDNQDTLPHFERNLFPR